MRIGILTLPPHINYGGILQAYALQTILERIGHEVVLFDCPFEKYKLPVWKKPLAYTKRFIKRYLLQEKNILLHLEEANFKKQCYIRQYTQKFINEHLHRYIIRRLSDIKESDFDAIVVGSDQVWRMSYFKRFWKTKHAENAFLAFTNDWNLKRVSYAASFGTDKSDIPEKEIDLCKKAISNFDYVSVREKKGIDICKNLFDINAKWVLDPTMLLTCSDYMSIMGNNEGKTYTNRTLMSYVLDENSDVAELRNEIAKEKNLTINISNIAENGSDKKGKVPQPPVENWLKSFIDADYVINDSFHACVFSILFHKQFVVYGNKERGMERFISLLSMFGLEDRLVTSFKEYKLLQDIDYTKVDEILYRRRQDAMSFLETSLK